MTSSPQLRQKIEDDDSSGLRRSVSDSEGGLTIGFRNESVSIQVHKLCMSFM